MFAYPFFRSTIWWSCQPTGPTWRVPHPRTITRTSRPRTTKIWRPRRGPRRARTPPTHKDKLPSPATTHHLRTSATIPPTPSTLLPTRPLFKTKPLWSCLIVPQLPHSPSSSCSPCWQRAAGKRIEDEKRQAQREADASEPERSFRAGRAQVQHNGSEVSPPTCFWVVTHETWPGCDGFAPWANTACQHNYTQK